MRTLFAIITLLGLCLSVNAQDYFLERLPGVVSIEYNTHTGPAAHASKKVNHTDFYNSDGYLIRRAYNSSELTYTHEKDRILRKRSALEHCVLALHIDTTKNGVLIINSEELPNEAKPGGYNCEYPMMPMLQGKNNHAERFKEVPKTVSITAREHYRSVQVDGDCEGEYQRYGYWKSDDGKKLRLSLIVTVDSIGEDLFIRRVYESANAGKDVELVSREIVDQYGKLIKRFDSNVYQEEVLPPPNPYKYEYDQQGNWIKRIRTEMKGDRIYYEERLITYR